MLMQNEEDGITKQKETIHGKECFMMLFLLLF